MGKFMGIFAYRKVLVLVLAGLLWLSGGMLAEAQDSPEPQGVAPAPATGESDSLTLYREAPSDENESTDIPEVSDDAPVARTSGGGSGTTFLLVVMLALFGLYLYNNQGLNARISRLEAALRGGAGRTRERDELVPFSWNSVLRSLEGGFAVLPGLVLPKPCVMLIGVEAEGKENNAAVVGRLRILAANVVRSVLQDPELAVLAVMRHVGSCELGNQLLTMLGSRPWQELSEADRQNLLRSHGKELEHYEKTLYCLNDLVLTPTQLYQTCQELLVSGDLGAILLDDLSVLVPDEHLSQDNENAAEMRRDICEALRLLAVRCHVPICVLTGVGSTTWETLNAYHTPGAMAKVTFTNSGVRAEFTQASGVSAGKQWQYDETTGAMSVIEEEAQS